MIRLTNIFTLIFITLCLNSFVVKASSNNSAEFVTVYNHIIEIDNWPAISAEVKNYTFTRDAAEFSLDSGTVYMFKSGIYGFRAALFKGSGRFKLDHPDKVERDHYYRFFESDTSAVEMNMLFMIFFDSTYSEFTKNFRFDSTVISHELTTKLRYCLKFLNNDGDSEIHYSVLKSFLEKNSNDMFYSQIQYGKYDALFYQIDPYSYEEIKFYRNLKDAMSYRRELINQFHRQGSEYRNRDINPADLIDIEKYIINSNIETDLDFSSHCRINFSKIDKDSKWINFQLYHRLEIDSVLWGDGAVAEYYRIDGSNYFWLKLDPTDKTNYELDIYYDGDLLGTNSYGWVYLRSPNYWYPNHGIRRKSHFNMTFTYSDNYKLLSIGELKSTDEEDDYITSQWETKYKIRNCSFNIGTFEEESYEIEGLPEINVYMAETGRAEISHNLARAGIISAGDMIEVVGSDVVNSFNYFKVKFGDPQLSSISVTEIPYDHGEAFPGLVHLSWLTFQLYDDEANQQIFRAHEIAHQWWGIGVDFKTYHDQWISEGFAQYSGMCYAQQVIGDNEIFFETLESYKDKILNSRNYLLSTGQEAGPIWLGYRTNSSETRGDYDLIVYMKGAWVLHMLRNMMLDLDTMDETMFNSLLKDFYLRYRGRKASTYDFKVMTEEYIRKDMDWFFDQWIYGTDIPTYKFSYTTKKNNDGSFNVQCRVDQENVDDKFRMIVPALVKFSDGRYFRFRVRIQGKTTNFGLPPLPMEPSEIIFNDLHSVLCEVEYE